QRTPGQPGRAEPTRRASAGRGRRPLPTQSTHRQRTHNVPTTLPHNGRTTNHARTLIRISVTAKKVVDAWWLSLGPPRVDRFARGCPPQPPVASTPQFPPPRHQRQRGRQADEKSPGARD